MTISLGCELDSGFNTGHPICIKDLAEGRVLVGEKTAKGFESKVWECCLRDTERYGKDDGCTHTFNWHVTKDNLKRSVWSVSH